MLVLTVNFANEVEKVKKERLDYVTLSEQMPPDWRWSHRLELD